MIQLKKHVRETGGYWRSKRRRDGFDAFLFLLPNGIGFLVFTAIPVAASLWISFFDWSLLEPPVFVGLRNYVDLLTRDELFLKVLGNTVYYVLAYVSLNVILAMLLALWFTSRLPYAGVFKSLFFIPQVIPVIAIAMIWKTLFYPGHGLINQFLGLFWRSDINWLWDIHFAMPAIIITSVWLGFGYNMVIFIAGIKGIPKTLFEAAEIDGAGKWSTFWRVTLPMLSPSLFFALVMTIISSFQVFDQTFVMTAGSPANTTNTIVLYLYQNGFLYFQMGYASAIAWVLFAIIFTITMIQLRMQKTWVFTE